VATLAATTGRADVTDAQWAVLEPLLPRGKKPGRPPERTKRQLIDGIRWRVRAGAPWRDVPPAYGPWQTVYGLFRRWQRNGTWRKILIALQGRADAAGLIAREERGWPGMSYPRSGPPVPGQMARTSSACGPLAPWLAVNSTRWLSCRPRKPPALMAEW
jgi:transposase